MHMELTAPAAQLDLRHLLGLPGDRRIKTLVNWLVGTNAIRRAVAEEVLGSDKAGSAKLLINNALARRTKDSRRMALLAAVARLGLEVDETQWFDLLAFSRRFGPDVQAHIAAVLWNCRPGAGAGVNAI